MKYSYFLEIKEKKILITNKIMNIKVDIIIDCLIKNSNLKNDSNITISSISKLKFKPNYLRNNYTYDLVKKGNFQIWIMKELTIFHQDEMKKCYFQPIMPFCEGDIITLNMNILSQIGVIDISSIIWQEINTSLIEEIRVDYSSNLPKENIKFTRFCEIEILRNKWNRIDNLKNNLEIIQNFKTYFEENFIIEDIVYDDIGYYVFRITLQAKSLGIIQNTELGINIVIKHPDSFIKNEVKKNFLVFDLSNTIEIRLGDRINFYYTKSK